MVRAIAGQQRFQQAARRPKQQAKANDGSKEREGRGAEHGAHEDKQEMAERLVPHVSARSTIQMKNKKQQRKLQRAGAAQRQAGVVDNKA